MAASFIRLPADSTGKKVQSWENTVGSDDVHTQASVLTHTDGATLTTAAGLIIVGAAASDAVVAGNPLLAGARASTAAPSDVSADGDAVALWARRSGALVVDASTVAVPITDNSGSLTVDGTVTANAGTGPFPVSDNGGSLTVDNAGTFAVQATATNAGTFAVQDSEKVADNAGFTDGTTKVQPAGYIFDEAAGTALTENDAAAGRIDSKRAQIGVIEDETTRGRRATVTAGNALKVDASAVAVPVTDNAGSLTVDAPVGTPAFVRLSDGSAALTTSSGRLAVDASAVAVPVTDNSGSLTVDNGGTFATQDSQVIADNTGFTDGTSKLFMGGLIFDESAGTALTENDAAAARVDSKRAQVLVIEDETTRGRRATVTAANALKVDASGVAVPITDNAGSLTVDNAGTFAVQPAGSIANDGGAGAVNPSLIGGYASAAVPGDVNADNDAVRAWMTRSGAQVVTQVPHLPFLANPYTLTTKTVTASTAQTGTVVWTPTSGKRLVITYFQIQSAGTTAGTAILWFELNDADTTYTRNSDLALFDGEFAPSATLKPGIAMSGLWIASAVDRDLRYTTTNAQTITITVWGYEV